MQSFGDVLRRLYSCVDNRVFGQRPEHVLVFMDAEQEHDHDLGRWFGKLVGDFSMDFLLQNT